MTRKNNIFFRADSNTEFAAALKIIDSVDRSWVEENKSGILEVIKEIAIFGDSADDRRRTETLR